MTEFERLMQYYGQLLAKLKLNEEESSIENFEKHLPFLQQLDRIESGGVLVFDTYRRDHIYISKSFEKLFGYKTDDMHKEGNDFFDSRVHPDDIVMLLQAGICHLEYYFSLSECERKELKFKLINEYRIKNAEGKYVKVLEQFVILQRHNNGDVWLVLSVMDISPDQNLSKAGKSRLHNVSSGELFEFPPKTDEELSVVLSKRETQILKLISKGLISKQIADQLYISVNTVNTHRQRIIEKLNVSNTFEAIQFAHSIGLFVN